jgi:hypothetical protein
MIAVALVGLIVFGSITAMRMGSRAKFYQSQALTWKSVESVQRKQLVRCRKEEDGMVRAASKLRANLGSYHVLQAVDRARQIADLAIWWRANLAYTEEMIAYSSMMRRKYEHASRYPWLAVAPDPRVPYWSGETGAPPDEVSEILEQQPAETVERLIKTVVDHSPSSAVTQRTP